MDNNYMNDINNDTKPRALLVAVNLNNDRDFERSCKELAALTEACDMEVAGLVTQNMTQLNQGLYIGTGKVAEVKETISALEADLVIVDSTLTPSQLRNLQDELDISVVDRTNLILQIFSSRARTGEAKMQCELASLQYMLPRLVGMRASLSRQGGSGAGKGGTGSLSNKGAGETKLELDRRHIEHRISELKKDLEAVTRDRNTQRQKRINSQIPQVALIGYTNAGKSTLMNAMIDTYVKDESRKVMVKDMLFATLDTTVRKIVPEDNRAFLLSDTVGFIDKLPHTLVKAFRSTLEEACMADLLLMVIDYSDPDYKEHIRVTRETIEELGAGDIPILYLYNKADLVMDASVLPVITENGIYCCAKQQEQIPAITKKITDTLFSANVTCDMLIPYDKGNILSYLMENAQILKTDYLEDGTLISVNCTPADYSRFSSYSHKN